MTHIPPDIFRNIGAYSVLPRLAGVNRDSNRVETELLQYREDLLKLEYPSWKVNPAKAFLYAANDDDLDTATFFLSRSNMRRLDNLTRQYSLSSSCSMNSILFAQKHGLYSRVSLVESAVRENRLDEIYMPDDYKYLIAVHRNREAIELLDRNLDDPDTDYWMGDWMEEWLPICVLAENFDMLNYLKGRYGSYFRKYIVDSLRYLSKAPSDEMTLYLSEYINFQNILIASLQEDMLRWALRHNVPVVPDFKVGYLSPESVDFCIDNLYIDWTAALVSLSRGLNLSGIRRIVERMPDAVNDTVRALPLDPILRKIFD